MKIYKFPIKVCGTTEFQPIDIDYIVSVGPVFSMSYTGGCIGESFAYFDVFIKMGESIRLTQLSGTRSKCPDEIIEELKSERSKLIEFWETNKNYIRPREEGYS